MKLFDFFKLNIKMTSALRKSLISLFAVFVSLLLCMIIIALIGIDPIFALKNLIIGAFGSTNALAETMVKMTPLLFTGMSFAIANRCGLTNLGMEGQLYMGALGATAVGIYVTGLPIYFHIPLALLAGFISGGIWGWIAGFLKVKTGASEVITTVMLDTIAIYFCAFMVAGPMIQPPGINVQTPPVLATAILPKIIPGTRIHLGFVIALVFVFLFWLFISKSKKGYEVRVAGQNFQAALYSGINTSRNIMLVMFLAGGLGGLAGATEILGIQKMMLPSISPGYGWDGIAVSMIGMNAPVGIVVGAFLFGSLRAGGNMMQMLAKVPNAFIKVMGGFVIVAVVASNIILEKWDESRLKKQMQEAESLQEFKEAKAKNKT